MLIQEHILYLVKPIQDQFVPMTPYSQCSKSHYLSSATTLCRCVGWTWPNRDCYICFALFCFCFLFFSLPNYIMWCVTGVFPQSTFLDSEANGRCSLKAKEKETKLNPIRGMTEHSCGLMISPPHPCQNPGRAEWFESHRLPRWLLSATCVHHRPRRARVMLLWREPSFPWWMGR